MTELLFMATIAVAGMSVSLCLKDLGGSGAALRRWRQHHGGRSDPDMEFLIQHAVEAFSSRHRLSEQETARLQEVRSRPGMVPVTLLLQPDLVTRKQGKFERGARLNVMFGLILAITIIFPPSVGLAMNHIWLWFLPLLNVGAFLACMQLVKNVLPDMSLLNLLLTGKAK
ncbi:hypothetical protein [Candidatus Pantoea multigeneris]|uniref:Uncharacterized protein n=1 Tax=Candidatus Pantoea multigeneris TaxID=2608357 RepID=A0ABX0RHZ7_9GAMM|nr:hypothetical protein [Pantoea multigeneris]NIF23936.1 hypothetical protein [Pantoea multigeneris]